MCKVISTISYKGGVGKTTSAVNISSFIQMQGKRVCAIDLDPQHNLSRHFGILPGHTKNRPTIYDLFNAVIQEKEDDEINELVQKSIYHTSTVDVIPSTVRLSSLEKVIPSVAGSERLLEYILSFIKEKYEYIFLDVHSGWDMFSINALTAADSVLIPVEAHIFSSDGIDPVENMIHSARKRLNPRLKIEGIIITKYQGNTNYCREIYDIITREFGDSIHIYNDFVKYAIKVAEAPAFGICLHEYAPKIPPTQAYANIAMEVMKSA